MKVKDFGSQCDPQLNARILRMVKNLTCRYGELLPDGWRCCIELQDKDEDEPYYRLDLTSDKGGGDFAPVKLQMLRLFPEICATGNVPLPDIITVLEKVYELDNIFFARLSKMSAINQLTVRDWNMLKDFGITRWYGGIRVPYEILSTEYDDLFDDETASHDKAEWANDQFINTVEGEVRIAFSGAREWQDMFFCFSIFKQLQGLLNETWARSQISYDLEKFSHDSNLLFWVNNLSIEEAPFEADKSSMRTMRF